MRKKKTLYEVNRWNRPAFLPEENLFKEGGGTWSQLAFKNDPLGSAVMASQGFNPGQAYSQTKNAFGITKAANPFSKGNLQGLLKGGDTNGLMGALGSVSGVVSDALSGGHSSGVGSTLKTVGSIAKNVPIPIVNKIGMAAEIVGGAFDGLFGGPKVNEQALKEANEGTAQLNSFVSNAGSFDDIHGPQAVANVGDVYENSVFGGGASAKNEELKRQRTEAKMFADRSILNNVNNLAEDQLNNALAIYAAFGGPIETIGDDNMGAIGYGFMSDYLASKKKQAEQKEKMSNMFMNTPSLFADGGGLNRDKDYKSEKKPYPSVKKGDFAGGGRSYPIPTKADAIDALRLAGLHHRPDVKAKVYRKYPELKHADSGSLNLLYQDNTPLFAFGGDMQTNGADYGTGLTHIDAGGSHEESPYDGVQMGVDQEGVPNLVEEGEVVWDDYVFSNRIELDEEAKKKFHFPKKKSITYAEAAKKLEKEISERPNDPISRSGFEAQMQTLEEEQERQKQEMEAERAKAAFEALSPEEQVAVMENAAQQEQMAQQAAMQEQAMTQQQAQPSPEEQAMMQQQAMLADGSQAMVGQEAPMMAEGGHLYKGGGDKKKNVGTWKDDKENHWDVFTKPGLKRYIENIRQRLAMAPDDETRAAIRREAMNELNTLQQSYYDYVREGAADAVHGYDNNVLNHQKMFDRLYGNTGFYTTDENGNVRNLIADAINLPNGAATDDKPDNWFDGYNGPRTSIRNFGSTAYGDDKYYQDLVDEFKELGLTYAPNDNWKDDNGVLYGLSIPEEEAAKEAAASAPKSWDWNTGDWIDRAPVEGTVTSAVTPEQKAAEVVKAKEEGRRIVPIHTNPIFGIEDVGPLVSMGLMAAKVGKPDTGSLFSAVRGAGDVALADWMPRGDFAVYKPDDPWFYTSPIIAQSNATQRAIGNKVSPTKGAETLANSYNTMTALGQAQRQQLDSNFDKYMKVKQYNGTIYDANQKEYGQTSRFNANARNDAARSAAQLNLAAAREAMDANAAFDQNWYGNIGALTKAIGARRKENRTRNMIADMAATGIFGNMNPDTFIANGMLRYETDEERRKRLGQPAAEGGKIKNRRRLKI